MAMGGVGRLKKREEGAHLGVVVALALALLCLQVRRLRVLVVLVVVLVVVVVARVLLVQWWSCPWPLI